MKIDYLRLLSSLPLFSHGDAGGAGTLRWYGIVVRTADGCWLNKEMFCTMKGGRS